MWKCGGTIRGKGGGGGRNMGEVADMARGCGGS